MLKSIPAVVARLGTWWRTPKTYPNGSAFSPAQHVIYAASSVMSVSIVIGSYVMAFALPSVWTFGLCMGPSALAWWFMATTSSALPKERS